MVLCVNTIWRLFGVIYQSSAGPDTASGRRSRDGACLSDGPDPCRRWARPSVGVSRVGGRLVRYFLVWDVILLSGASPAASESPGLGRACP